MRTKFRKILIQVGKWIPFALAFLVAMSYAEIAYVLHFGLYEDADCKSYVLYTPLGNTISYLVYVDWFDVLLLYIIGIALEYCKYNLRCVHYLLINLFVRFTLGHFLSPNGIAYPICIFMAVCGIYCASTWVLVIKKNK